MSRLDRSPIDAFDDIDIRTAGDDSFENHEFDRFGDEDLDSALPLLRLLRRIPRRRSQRRPAVRPGTKCTEAQHRLYYGRVGQACKQIGPRSYGLRSCNETDSVEQLFAKAAIAQGCATARQAYQRRCFNRSHPGWQGHEQARNQAERIARRCWEMGRRKQALESQPHHPTRRGRPFDVFDTLDEFGDFYDFDLATTTPSRRRTSPHAFLQEALRRVSHPRHPLHFLVVPRCRPDGQLRYQWRTTTRTTASGRRQTGRYNYQGHETGPIVQVGHQGAFAAGVPEQLMLEDAGLNQQTGQNIESRGAYSFKDAVIIGGVPVDVASAQQWERLGLLSRGTVARSPRRPSPLP
jgi:hypothetical protein